MIFNFKDLGEMETMIVLLNKFQPRSRNHMYTAIEEVA